MTTACVGPGITGADISHSMEIGVAHNMIRTKKAEMRFLADDLADIPDQVDAVDDQLVDLDNQLTAACSVAGTYESYQEIQDIGSQIMSVGTTGVGMLEGMMFAFQSSYDDITMRFNHAYTRLKVRLATFLTAANDVMSVNSATPVSAIQQECIANNVVLWGTYAQEEQNRLAVVSCIGNLSAQASVLP